MEQEPCLKGEQARTPRIVSRPRKTPWIRMEGPDGGWAWMVAFSACIISFIMAGLGRMSGILYVAFIEWFGVDRQAAAAPFSIRSSTRNLLGPVVGILGQKYGVRVVTIFGGVLATLSAASCFFAPDVIWMTILWGALNGIGASLTVTLPQVIVGQYFVKYTTTATGMAFSGGCVGSFLFPVLLEQLLHAYGVQGTFLVLGAIIMHTIPAAMILRKPPWLKGKKTRNNNAEGTDCLCESSALKEELLSSKDVKNVSEIPKSQNDEELGKCKDKSGAKDFPDVQFLRQNNDTVLKILSMRTPMDNFLTVSAEVNQNVPFPHREARIAKEIEDVYSRLQSFQKKVKFYNILRTFKKMRTKDALLKSDVKSLSPQKSQSFQFAITSEFDSCDVYKTCSVPDIFRETKKPTRSYVVQKLKDLRSCPEDVLARFPEEEKNKVSKILAELRKLYEANVALDGTASRDSLTEYGDVTEKSLPCPPIGGRSVPSNTFWSHMLTAVKLHRNPIFLLICLCRTVHFFTLVPVMTTIVDFLMDKGFQEEDGKYAIAALSLGDLLGRLCFGWVTDRNYMSLAKYMTVVMVLQGVSTASLPLMDTKTTLYITLGGFGLLQGSLFVRHNVLVSKYMDDGEQSIAMGCINFLSGILGFGLPAYIGYFRDTLGTYDYIFYINGAINFFTGLPWIFEQYLLSCSSPKIAVHSPEAV